MLSSVIMIIAGCALNRSYAQCVWARVCVCVCAREIVCSAVWFLLQITVRAGEDDGFEQRVFWMQPNRCSPIHLNSVFNFFASYIFINNGHTKRECFFLSLCVCLNLQFSLFTSCTRCVVHVFEYICCRAVSSDTIVLERFFEFRNLLSYIFSFSFRSSSSSLAL